MDSILISYHFLISFQIYVAAINSGVEDIREAILSPEARKALVSTGPVLVREAFESKKVVDSEDTSTKYKKQDDGTLVTEKTRTTAHEEFHDGERPENEPDSAIERVEHNVSLLTSVKRQNF